MMMTPAVLHNDGVFDFNFFFLEVGVTLIFVGLFGWMTLSALSKAGIYAKNHPMLEESIHHDVF